jgi:hypothetical protein
VSLSAAFQKKYRLTIKENFKRVFFLQFLVLNIIVVKGQETLVLTDKLNDCDLSLYLSYFIDFSNSKRFDEIKHLHAQGRFFPNGSEVPTFGVTNKDSWFFFRMQNRSVEKNWLVNINFPDFHRVVVHLMNATER